MKYIFFLLLVVFLFSCKKDKKNPDNTEEISLVLTATAPPFTLSAIGAKFFKNISYGNKERNKFDLFLPESGTPTGLVIFIHGGGFIGGDKTIAYSNAGSKLFIDQLLLQNYAFATINYQYLELNESVGILKPLRDCKRALQFMRFHSDALNIEKGNIVMMGNSAGSGASLWIAFNDDMADPNAEDKVLRESTRVKGVVAGETQASYDILEWHNTVFLEYQSQGFDFGTVKTLATEGALMLFYGVNNMNALNSPAIQADRQKLDYLNMFTADDPEIHLDNSMVAYTFPADNNSLLHHPLHSKVLMDKATSIGVNSRVYLPTMNIDTRNGENMFGFVIRKLNE